MTLDLALALSVYAFVTSITPGPNNTMLLAAGANFGFRASIPHMLGVNLGFGLMLLAVGFGIGSLFTAFPLMHDVLRYGGAAYLVYLAWKIATASGPDSAGNSAKPISFLQATAFQWVNPKAWIMAIGAMATYVPAANVFLGVLAVTLVFTLINAPCIVAWTAMGTGLRRVMGNPLHLRILNVSLALLLLASLYPIFA